MKDKFLNKFLYCGGSIFLTLVSLISVCTATSPIPYFDNTSLIINHCYPTGSCYALDYGKNVTNGGGAGNVYYEIFGTHYFPLNSYVFWMDPGEHVRVWTNYTGSIPNGFFEIWHISVRAAIPGDINVGSFIIERFGSSPLQKNEIGVYQNGAWYLDNDGSGTWNTGDRANAFGAPGWTPVLGDWNASGFTYMGIYKDGVWYLDWNGNGAWDGGDRAYSFGAPGWTPVTGDWNHDGKTDIGITNGQQWYLDMNNNGAYDGGVDKAYSFGAPGWSPVVGDWNATGNSYIGVTNGQQWYLDWNGNGAWDGTDKAYSFGAPGWTPIVGKWS